ncbi:hypothetical protein N7408_18105 [Pseudomonas otitidis]|nr:hypothetical protein [Pseudomonas otitidis]MDG9783111.1 hypothetical protein [Pseudomonas otitidis]
MHHAVQLDHHRAPGIDLVEPDEHVAVAAAGVDQALDDDVGTVAVVDGDVGTGCERLAACLDLGQPGCGEFVVDVFFPGNGAGLDHHVGSAGVLQQDQPAGEGLVRLPGHGAAFHPRGVAIERPADVGDVIGVGLVFDRDALDAFDGLGVAATRAGEVLDLDVVGGGLVGQLAAVADLQQASGVGEVFEVLHAGADVFASGIKHRGSPGR